MRIALPVSMISHILILLVSLALMANRQYFIPVNRDIFPVELIYLPAISEKVSSFTPPSEPKPTPKVIPQKREAPLPIIRKEEPTVAIKKIEPVVTPVPETPEIPATVTESVENPVPVSSDIRTNQIKVEIQDFTFTYYLNIIHHRIQKQWNPSYQSQAENSTINTIVGFTILRDGTVRNIVLEKSSDRFLFDQAAQRAIYALGQLPPLPQQFNNDELFVHIQFEAIR
ncbi:MAG: TonB family protein [Candidatus Marinimicrobia bacterium]|nr:TonB family protein [bacterium]MCG2715184.1 TonB family protein [Candidatus Neomarinimicrobiota bacterium]